SSNEIRLEHSADDVAFSSLDISLKLRKFSYCSNQREALIVVMQPRKCSSGSCRFYRLHFKTFFNLLHLRGGDSTTSDLTDICNVLINSVDELLTLLRRTVTFEPIFVNKISFVHLLERKVSILIPFKIFGEHRFEVFNVFI